MLAAHLWLNYAGYVEPECVSSRQPNGMQEEEKDEEEERVSN